MHLVQAFNFVKAGLLRGLRIFRAKLGSSPLFLGYVMLGQKEDFNVGIRVDEQRRARFEPSGEIKEVILLAKAIKIIRAFSFRGSKQDERAAFHLFGQRDAASMVISIVLALRCVGTDTGGKDTQAYQQRLF